MIYLAHELALLQAEAQGYDAQIAPLNASATQQDQAAAAASARAAAARTDASRLSGEASSFQAQATAADKQAATFDQQITQQKASEPEQMNEIPNSRGKPRYVRNPEWTVWKKTYDSLVTQRDQARAAATAARTTADQRSAAAAQSQAAAVAADKEAANAVTAAAQLRQQVAQLNAQKDAVTQRMAPILRWQQELARQPLDRNALETTARELNTQLDQLESQYTAALDAAGAAERQQWYLQTLTQELNTKINDLNAQLAQAVTDETNARAAVTDLQRRIHNVLLRKPE